MHPGLNSGFTNLSQFKKRVNLAKHDPASQSTFKQYFLNIWQYGADLPFIPIETYDKAYMRRDLRHLEGLDCFAGIDLSSVEDLTCVSLVFPESVDVGGTIDMAPLTTWGRDRTLYSTGRTVRGHQIGTPI